MAHAEVDQANGKALDETWCATCHGVGSHFPATQGLAKRFEGTDTPAALEDPTDLTENSVHYFVRNGISIMPFFRKTELTDSEITDISAYLMRNNPAE